MIQAKTINFANKALLRTRILDLSVMVFACGSISWQMITHARVPKTNIKKNAAKQFTGGVRQLVQFANANEQYHIGGANTLKEA
jgi:hypothetical protein